MLLARTLSQQTANNFIPCINTLKGNTYYSKEITNEFKTFFSKLYNPHTQVDQREKAKRRKKKKRYRNI